MHVIIKEAGLIDELKTRELFVVSSVSNLKGATYNSQVILRNSWLKKTHKSESKKLWKTENNMFVLNVINY